ncbi:gigasin-6-like [Mizuhopecten yessoensis]|uniref:gigasin-6-like n=1 Tax=Mizuhopecten yessoensis TaxID=6573 RepID=UPI000B45AD63|nr:gigasin-6-like [Mizuhopecten yessoensis]
MAGYNLVWLLVGSLVLVCELSLCQHSFIHTVDHVLRKVLQCHPTTPGLAVSVVKGGHVLLSRGYGMRNKTTQEPVTNTTLFALGSVSKAFAATLLMKQLAAHNLTIYSNVADIFGNGFQFSTAVRTEYAAIRDLLSHTMGLPRHNMIHLDPTLTLQTLPSRMKYLKSNHPFQSVYEYNNLMYGLVSAISEKLGRKSWEKLVEENLYTHLGMSSSSFLSKVDLSVSKVAQGYVTAKATGHSHAVPFELLRAWGNMPGAIGVMSSAEDMTKWMMFHLSGGRSVSGTKVMDSDILASIYYPRNSIGHSSKYFSRPNVPVATSEYSYAFGWRNGYYRGYPILRHTGTISGYSSLLTLIPNSDIGIFTSMTGSDSDYVLRTLLHNYLADVALGETPWLNETTLCTFPEPWMRKDASVSSAIETDLPFHRDVNGYAGTYHNDLYGTITLHVSSPHRHLVMQYGIATWFLYPQHAADSFSGKGHGLAAVVYDLKSIVFHTAAHGHIHSMVISSFESSDPPVFIKSASHSTSHNGPAFG